MQLIKKDYKKEKRLQEDENGHFSCPAQKAANLSFLMQQRVDLMNDFFRFPPQIGKPICCFYTPKKIYTLFSFLYIGVAAKIKTLKYFPEYKHVNLKKKKK